MKKSWLILLLGGAAIATAIAVNRAKCASNPLCTPSLLGDHCYCTGAIDEHAV